jgi:two-component system sensor histidine kinase PilS (NtrC family)
MANLHDVVILDEALELGKLRRLKLLSLSRLVLAGFLTVLLAATVGNVTREFNTLSPTFVALMYVFAALAALWVLQYGKLSWRGQLFAQLLADIGLIGLLVSSLGGSAGGFAILYLMPIAVAASLLNWTGSLFVCSICVLFLLADGSRRYFILQLDYDWAQLGIQGLMSYGLMSALRYSVMRAEQRESLIRRGLMQERLIKELQEQHIQEDTLGWIVIDPSNTVQLMNAPARSLAWRAGMLLDIGHTIVPADSVFSWLKAINQTQEISVPWPPIPLIASKPLQSDGGKTQSASAEHLFVKAAPLPHMAGLIALTLELSSARNERNREQQLATMGRLSASIAHEIRNPLAAISQAAELLNEASGIQAADRPLLDMLVSNTQRIDRIIHNLLSWSRGTQASPINLNPELVVRQMAQQIAVGLKLKPEQLLIEPAIEQAQSVWFDEDQLYQILSNLMSNAARYASGQPNSICLTFRPRGRFLALLVLDDGPPVDATVAAHLFEPFQTASKQGTGLGLFLCREYAQANQGGLQLMHPELTLDSRQPWVPAPYTKAFVLNLPLSHTDIDHPFGQTNRLTERAA